MSKDKIRDWFFSLPEDTRNQIDDIVEQIREKEGFIEEHEQSLRHLVKDLARMLEPLIDDPSKISVIIKAIANGRISDETIEKALPEDKKRKHKAYERYQDTEIKSVDFQDRETVTVASDGSESYTKPDGSEGEQEREEVQQEPAARPEFYEGDPDVPNLEQSAEIALTTIDVLRRDKTELETRLKEAFSLNKDKDKRIYELELKQGELELRIGSQGQQKSEKDVDTLEEKQIEIDDLKQTIKEMQEIERERTKRSDFNTASTIPKRPWVAAVNALYLMKGLRDGKEYALQHNDPWKKVLFDIAEDGQLKNARLEGT